MINDIKTQTWKIMFRGVGRKKKKQHQVDKVHRKKLMKY